MPTRRLYAASADREPWAIRDVTALSPALNPKDDVVNNVTRERA